MRVIYSAHAKSELRAIALYIAKDDKLRAQSFVREARRKAEDLARSPLAFPLVPEFAHAGIRRRVHGSYLIFYRADLDAVRIIHVLHGARHYESILASDS